MRLHHCVAKALCAAPFILLLTACGGGKATINVNDYFTTELKGYNGGGSVSAELDTASLVADYSDAFGLTDSDSVLVFNSVISNVNEHLTGDFDNNEMLGNGDQISFIWDKAGIDTLETEYNIKFNVEDVTMDVADLPEIQDFNPFDYITIEYEKVSAGNTAYYGSGDEVRMNVVKNDDFPIPDIYFYETKGRATNYGDTFTLEARIVQSGFTLSEEDVKAECLKYGLAITQFEQDYTVPSSID